MGNKATMFPRDSHCKDSDLPVCGPQAKEYPLHGTARITNKQNLQYVKLLSPLK